MSCPRSILVQVDPSPGAVARLESARAIALRCEAALAAMYVASPPQRPLQMALSEGLAALGQDADRSALESTRRRFDDVLARGGPDMHWLEPAAGDDAADAFCREALYADLLLLPQHDPSAAPGMGAPPDFVESAILRSGRPALVLPTAREGNALGERVLIGWNASPSAAHAVTAALPWLSEARSVHVLEAMSDEPPPVQGLDIVRYLGFHGVVARRHRQRAAPQDVGDVLLSLACDVGADLLVMGCYGRGRAREWVLGGASRTVLQTMTLPVLMAH